MKRKQRLVDRGSIPKHNYPLSLMLKWERKNICMETERKNRCMETRGEMVPRGEMVIGRSMSVTMPSVFPSIAKGDVVEILVFIDVNP
jgi:hypothetical protein